MTNALERLSEMLDKEPAAVEEAQRHAELLEGIKELKQVRTLLWEIARLQQLVAKMDDFFRAMSRNRHANRFDSVSQKILDEIYAELQNEPAISERDGEE